MGPPFVNNTIFSWVRYFSNLMQQSQHSKLDFHCHFWQCYGYYRGTAVQKECWVSVYCTANAASTFANWRRSWNGGSLYCEQTGPSRVLHVTCNRKFVRVVYKTMATGEMKQIVLTALLAEFSNCYQIDTAKLNSFYFFQGREKTLGSAPKIRVGRVSGNNNIFFFGLK